MNYFYSNQINPAPAAAAVPGGFAWNNQMGNPDLDSETADTWTAGFVVQSPWEGALVRGLSATIDWYKISMEDVIEPYSVDYARYLCYGTTTGDQRCGSCCSGRIRGVQERAAWHGPERRRCAHAAAEVQQPGDGRDGRCRLRVQLVREHCGHGAREDPGRPRSQHPGHLAGQVRDEAVADELRSGHRLEGLAGSERSGLQRRCVLYRLFSSLSYTLPTMNFSFRWRYLPGVDQTTQAQEAAIKKNNARVTAGGDGILPSYTPTTLQSTPSYSHVRLLVQRGT